jgi:RNA polymerase sigma-70 factor (ECF subfamily)
LNKITEDNLIGKIANGDELAFNEIYFRHRNRVYGFIYRMTINQPLAEDITHETFMVLIEHPERYRAERGGSLLTFLCAVARKQLMNHLRRKHNSDVGFDEVENFDSLEDETKRNPLSNLLNQELRGAD